MSDVQKPDDHRSNGDRAAEQRTAPVDPETVEVTVVPQQEKLHPVLSGHPATKHAVDRNNAQKQGRADRVTGPATKEVREAVREAAPDGHEAQVDAAQQAARDVGGKLPAETFKGVNVKIPGEPDFFAPATEGAGDKPPTSPGSA